ncbi:MAG TPA: HEAT repeat domain-containing protein [Anaeromyxobacter sp.]|nr:HEAT repeat domain-containing protein [Anaeromyxobacter sp.]
MRRFSVAALVLSLAVPASADPQIDAAIRALRRDSSMKVRTQAAIVLGQRLVAQAVPALREAVAEDQAAAVRIAAVAALAKIGDRGARSTLRAASDADPDGAVRSAAKRALEALGPVAVSIDEPSGPGSARGPMREALAAHLRERGYEVGPGGEYRLKPAIKVDVERSGAKTVIAIRASVVLVDGDGRVDMVESSARASVTGAIPDGKLQAYAARAIDAAAKNLSEDLAARLGGR